VTPSIQRPTPFASGR